MSVIEIRDIKAPDRKRRGQVFEGRVARGQHATVTPRVSIVLHGSIERVSYESGSRLVVAEPYERAFRLGDWAEYGSYNLRYTGRIVAIGAACVTIEDADDRRRYRLDIYSFNLRNRDFDLAKCREHNAAEMQCI